MNNKPRFSIGYSFLKIWVRAALRIFYRRVTVIGAENLPRTGGVILFANHQNAMIDPFALCCFSHRDLHWLARADVFKKKSNARILNHLHMIPIHRERDNTDLQAESAKTFANCVIRLKEHCVIGMFPEGGHHDQKFIRPFKKGMGRILASAVEDDRVEMVPVYIDYHGTSFRDAVLIQFGNPSSYSSSHLDQDDFISLTRKSSLAAREELISLAIHIPDRAMGEQLEKLRPVLSAFFCKTDKINSPDEYRFYKGLTDALVHKCESDENFKTQLLRLLAECIIELPALKRTISLSGKSLFKNIGATLIRLTGYISTVFHILPAWVSDSFTRKFVKDHHFHSSVLLIVGLFSFSIYYLLILIFVFLLSPGFTAGLLTAFVLMVTGYLSLKQFDVRKNLFPVEETLKSIPLHKPFLELVKFLELET